MTAACRRRVAAAAGLILCLLAAPARAQDAAIVPAATDPVVTLRWSLKMTGLIWQAPDDPAVYPGRHGATGFWRARVEPTVRLGASASFELAYEQRARAFSSAASLAGAGVLPPESAAPYRAVQLDGSLASSSHGSWRHEIDRAALHARLPHADVTIGRQAIGWGRGIAFGAVDLFSPFAPLEVDREWRRGVDAIRIESRLTERLSADVVAAFGSSRDESAFAGRVRGYAGRADLEVVGGRRAGDSFVGITSSSAVAGAELHGELAAFRTPAAAGSAAFGSARTIIKAVAGGSYQLAVGSGLLVDVEYHYSGFGAVTSNDLTSMLQDPAFVVRYLRADTQLIGRHGVAVLASYEVSPLAGVTVEWVLSPRDGSGVVMPSLALTFNDRWSMTVTGHAAYGTAPAGTRLRSEYGASPSALLLQARYFR